MYCPRCKLDLREWIGASLCPECERPFDPRDENSTLPSLSLASRVRYAFFIPRCAGPPAQLRHLPQWTQWEDSSPVIRQPARRTARDPWRRHAPARRPSGIAAAFETAVLAAMIPVAGTLELDPDVVLLMLAPYVAWLVTAFFVRSKAGVGAVLAVGAWLGSALRRP